MTTTDIATPYKIAAGSGIADLWWKTGRVAVKASGAETGGAFAQVEIDDPLGSAPPLHIHHGEDETFYVLEGRVDFRLDDGLVTAGSGDFVNIPRGRVHNFHNATQDVARLILTFTPAGIERFFEETLERVADPTVPQPDNVADVAARYAEAGPRYGIKFLTS